MEDGQVAGSCSDGIDNGGDGTADANDPDCLVGDNFGGGNAVARPIGCLDNAFYAAKNGTEAGAGAGSCSDSTDNDGDGLVDSLDPDCRNAQFAPQRKLVFRYGISGHPGIEILAVADKAKSAVTTLSSIIMMPALSCMNSAIRLICDMAVTSIIIASQTMSA